MKNVLCAAGLSLPAWGNRILASREWPKMGGVGLAPLMKQERAQCGQKGSSKAMFIEERQG